MRLWWLIALIVVLAVGAVLLLVTNQDEKPKAAYELTSDGRGICKRGEKEPFLYAADLPDTVPRLLPHVADQRFVNRRFHFLAISPDERFLAFACGEGDQWLGTVDMTFQYVKFIIFGIQTTFYGAEWSPDSKYLAYAFYGPDRRMQVYITDPLTRDDPLPKNMNVWFKLLWQGEQFKPIGWKEPGDTIFSFAILDAKGKEIERVNLPLHFNPAAVPDHMKVGVGK